MKPTEVKLRMETLREAIDRLEERGFGSAFRPMKSGLLRESGGEVLAPEDLVLVETVRFEGESDPGDAAVLFALRTRDSRIRGTFVATYGPQTGPECAAVLERLPNHPAGDRRTERPTM